MQVKSMIYSGIVLLGTTLCSLSFAQPETSLCPTLTAKDVRYTINHGTISTHQGYSLADEARLSPAQVLMNEPSSNPFDTYYSMWGSKKVGNLTHVIYVGNVLGKNAHEAKHRAKRILLDNRDVFFGKYDASSRYCIYEQIHASPSYTNYPFKSEYETVTLLSVAVEKSPHLNLFTLLKK